MANQVLNSAKRIPLLFCVDTSDSMRTLWETSDIKALGEYDTVEGERVMLAEGGITYLEDVKKKLSTFIEAMSKKLKVKYAADVSLVTFGSEIKREIDFTTLDKFDLKDKLIDASGTSMFCSSFLYCLSLVSQRYKYYRENGIMYHPARIIVFTDGKITDGHMLNTLKEKIAESFGNTNLFVFIVSLESNDVNFAEIKEATDATIIHFDQTSISNFFDFLGRSLSTNPNEKGQQRPKDVVRLGSDVR